MAVSLKPLNQQTIVITGATSGIGLSTARKAAEAGAKLVLAARSEDDLRTLADEIRSAGGAASTVVADVGNHDDVRRIAEAAVSDFGGVVHGSLEAAKLLKERGGALINVGSTASDRAFPLQGMYCAAKHAVKGFTDALRLELEEEGAPVSVTLIKPAGIDTPYTEHAK